MGSSECCGLWLDNTLGRLVMYSLINHLIGRRRRRKITEVVYNCGQREYRYKVSKECSREETSNSIQKGKHTRKCNNGATRRPSVA